MDNHKGIRAACVILVCILAVLAGIATADISYSHQKPNTDNNLDIGANSLRWKDGYFRGNVAIAGAITGATWNGVVIDISDYTNLAVNTDHLLLSDDTLNLSVNLDTLAHRWQASFLEQFDFTVSGAVTGSLEKEGTGDLIMFFSDEFTTLDCTPILTVDLTPWVGTDTEPNVAFVYVLQSNKTLTASDSWPAANIEHIRVASLVLQSAATTNTEGALMVRNWNNMSFGIDNLRGHGLHLGERLRFEHALWKTGVVLSVTGSGTSTITLATTAGTVYQLHLHTFPSLDMAGADNIHLVNLSGSEYSTSVNLVAGITTLADGATSLANNKYFNLVIWGVQNRSGETSHVMCNLPTGQYTKSADAIIDASKFSVHTIPSAFRGTGFLIAELTFQFIAGPTWTLVQNKDLLGQTPILVPGGGVTASISTFVDSSFEVYDDGDDSKRLAFQLSGVTAGQTRTLTVPNASGTIALTTQSDGTIVLATNTDGDYVATIATTSPLSGGSAGSEGATLTLTIADADDAGTKGAASFDATDFNDDGSGGIMIVDDGHAHTGTSVTGFIHDDADDAMAGKLTITKTTQQLELEYNDSNQVDFTVDSGGDLLLTASGGDISFGDENLGTTGALTVSTINAFTLAGKLTAGATEIEGTNFDINGGTLAAITINGNWTAAGQTIADLGLVTIGTFSSIGLRIGTSDTDNFIYFFDGGIPTGQYLVWIDSPPVFQFSTSLNVQGALTAAGVIFTDSDIYTTVAGADLWLGNLTKGSASFQADANGNLVAEGDIAFGASGELTVDTSGNLTTSATVQAAIVDITDETTGLQIDGSSFLWTGTSANQNLFIGLGTDNGDAGTQNIFMGFEAGFNNDVVAGSTGTQNIYIGALSGYGASAGVNNSGAENVAMGFKTLYVNKAGLRNFALGSFSLTSNTNGDNNVAIGYSAMRANVLGDKSIAIGSGAIFAASGAYNNVAIGNNAMVDATGVVEQNVVIGAQAGKTFGSADRNVFIGFQAGFFETDSDKLFIDNVKRASKADGKVKALIYGVFAATPVNQSLRINGEILGSYGAKIGDGGSSNYIEFSATGDVVFVGSAGLVYGGISAVENAVETTIASSGVKVQVTIFDRDMPSNNTTPENAEDHIKITKAGDYQIIVSATVNSVGGAGSVLELEVMKNNGVSRLGHLHADRTLGGGGTERGSISLSDIVVLAVDDTVELWIENETNTQNYIVEDVTLQVLQLGGT